MDTSSGTATFPYLQLVIGFLTASFFFETLLALRQHHALLLPSLPKPLQGIVSDERFRKARAYSLDKSSFGFVRRTFSFLVEILTLAFFVMPWLWEATHLSSLRGPWGLTGSGETVHSLVFVLASTLMSQVIDLPFSLYSTFVIEQRHGFNKQTLFGFFKDMFLGIVIMMLLMPPVLAGAIYIVKIGGSYVALYLWLFFASFSFFMMTVYPVLIAPLFNKFTPLEAGVLRSLIEELAGSLSYPLKKIFVMDGSQRSAHSNAYLYGFFKNKRIVLYDTLLAQCKDDNEEVVAVIAHELGHWKLGHTIQFFVLSQTLLLLQCLGFVFVHSQKDVFLSFGFTTQPLIIAVMLFQHLLTPISHILDFSLNAVSRRFEYQADAFAVLMGYAKKLRSGLIKMQEENLGAMNTDPWYAAYHYSHPFLAERLAGIEAEALKLEKKAQ